MLNKEDLVAGDIDFTIYKKDYEGHKTTGFVFKVKKNHDVYGARVGGKPKYIGYVLPKTGHLARTHLTSIERHAQVTTVFLWLTSLLWWSDGQLPDQYIIEVHKW